MNKTLFISDLHLSAEREDIAQCFFTFMNNEAIHADALYILGDLFEVWIGDDNKTEFSNAVANAIAKVGAKLPVYFIHGNRDFAVGKRFAEQAKMTLLPEQHVIDLYGTPVLISHGDELCTRDLDYMRFRRKARGWWWPKLMLSLPLSLRKRIANKGRETSQNNQKNLSAEIMDVTPEEVYKAMRKFKVLHFIHGHTHRPDIHHFNLDGKEATRIVLGDWYTQGSILEASKNGINLVNRSFSQ
ncbi:UDP-2,3-diacylglucosamine diphosphatase [Glaciecola sp. 2405UD65-10]|uniref:UDP-2,3-diacylglucosamine diphosphatase n=1 Tax=Glaciecola sp. 2405UD65-10 TaxID=3397244 RepID=UPI003B5927AA